MNCSFSKYLLHISQIFYFKKTITLFKYYNFLLSQKMWLFQLKKSAKQNDKGAIWCDKNYVICISGCHRHYLRLKNYINILISGVNSLS